MVAALNIGVVDSSACAKLDRRLLILIAVIELLALAMRVVTGIRL